jgi:hypothetical protein
MAKYQTVLRIRLSRTAHCVKYSGVRILQVILELLNTVIKKYTVFLDVKTCSMVEQYRHFWKKSSASIVGANWATEYSEISINSTRSYLVSSQKMYFSERITFRSCKRAIVSLAADNMLAKNLVIQHKSQCIMSHLFSMYFTIFSLCTQHNISTIFRYSNLFSINLFIFSYKFLVIRTRWMKGILM